MTQPLAMLPDAWAEKGRCPVCGSAPLAIERRLEADRLACGRCGTAFEVEDGGPRIRLARLPAPITAPPDGAWRMAAEAREWVRSLAAQRPAQTTPATPRPEPKPAPLAPGPAVAAPTPGLEPVPPEAPPSAASTENDAPPEALERARQLLALRHTLAQIEALLSRSGEWTPAQVRAVMASLAQADAQARARQKRNLWLAVGGTLGLLLVLFVGALALNWTRAAPPEAAPATQAPASPLDAFTRLFAPADPSRPGASTPPAGAVPADLPPQLATLLPPGARLVNPTPIIQRGPESGAPGRSACPLDAETAAGLFGGQADNWQYDQASGGWMMFSLELETVRVPEGMTAGYLTFSQSLSLSEVSGPAVIENVNMVAVLCS
jgi:hypothetical protein